MFIETILIPKVIVFVSTSMFYLESKIILNNIYTHYLLKGYPFYYNDFQCKSLRDTKSSIKMKNKISFEDYIHRLLF